MSVIKAKRIFAEDFVKAANKALAKLEKLPLNKRKANSAYDLAGTIGSMSDFLPRAAVKDLQNRIKILDELLERIY